MVAGILAWLGTCTAVLALFSYADKAASPEGKVRARALLDFAWKDTITRWPSVFVEMFDSIFGERHFTWRCFWRSCVASLAAVSVCSVFFYWLRPEMAGEMFENFAIADWWPLLLFFIGFNLLPDYFSLLETRVVLRILTRGNRTWMSIATAVTCDFMLTLMVFVGGGILLAVLLILFLGGNVSNAVDNVIGSVIPAFGFGPAHRRESLSLGIFLYSTFFTSIWLWLYALATFAGKLLLPILNRIQKFKKLVDLDNKPFLALGWLSVIIVTVGFAVVKACV